jgi:hypothetical protein
MVMFEIFGLSLQQIYTKASLVCKVTKNGWLARVLYNGKSQWSKNKEKIALYSSVYECP